MADADLQSLLAKALDTSTTNGNAFYNPVLLSQYLTEQVRRTPALRNILAREPFQGKTYFWDIKNAVGDAVTAADGATLSGIDPVTSQGSVQMSYFYFAAQITGPAQVASSLLVDLFEDRMRDAGKAIVRKEGSVIFNGDTGVSASNTPGLYSALSAAGTRFISGGTAGQTLQPNLLDTMEAALVTDGYDPGELVFVCSPRMAVAIKGFAFGHFRQTDDISRSQYGYPLQNGMSFWNTIPVLMDPYAAQNNTVSTESLSGSGTTYTFSKPNVVLYATSSGTDYAGTAEFAPVITVGAATATNYTLSQANNGTTTVTFTATPSAGPVATYVWKNENIYLLSTNKNDLVIPVSEELNVVPNIAIPYNQDILPMRVQQYSSLVVRNPRAHVLASNILGPVTTVGF